MRPDLPSLTDSLWAATAKPTPSFPTLHGTHSPVEIAIIGSGITGASAALHLAERGAKVALIEAHSPGWGASGRNGGQVLPGLKEDPDTVERQMGCEIGQRVVEASGNAPNELFSLVDRLGIDCDPIRSAWIQPAHTHTALANLSERVKQWARRGAPVALLGDRDLREILGLTGYVGGIIDRRGGSVHPLNFTVGLTQAARTAGANVYCHSPVLSLERDGTRYRIQTSEGTIHAQQVAVCTDAYTTHIANRFRRSIVPVISVLVATKPIPSNRRQKVLRDGIVVSDLYRLLNYYRFDSDGRLLIGGRGAYRQTAIRRQQARLRDRAQQLFGEALGTLQWETAWGGRVGLTADHYPHIHRFAPNLYAAGGYNGRGLAMATVLGRVLADALSGTEDGDLAFPISPLRPLPLHAFHPLAVTAAVMWNGWLDRRQQARPQRASVH